MSRRKSDDSFEILWDLFMTTPWWVCLVVAGTAYIILTYILPPMFSTQPLLKGLSSVSRSLAPLAVIVILFVGFCANLRKWTRGLMLDRQSGSDTINKLSWCEFEELIAAAYRRQDYRVIENGGGGADGGVDLILLRDGDKVLVQCKHWRSSQVGVKLVRELHGITHSKEHKGSRGIFVTFGTYTQDAERFARENNIELVNRKNLLEMIESAQHHRSTEVIPNTASDTPPFCPLCGSVMLLRTAKRGDKVGSQFWGCSAYPKCRGIRDC